MSNLPGNIATPTLVTGKTDKSQVVDIYDSSGIEAKAQNMINSVLDSADGTILESTKNAMVKLIDAKNFYKDLGGVINKFAAGGFSKDSLKSALKDYKKGALNTILEANGVKDLDTLKDNLLGAVQGNVKEFAFGYAKGFTDVLAPGVLDANGIKSFDDAKNLYKNIDAMVNDFSNMNSEAWLDLGLEQATPFLSGLSAGMLEKTLEVLDDTLGIGIRDIKVSDKELDNAILTGVCKGLIVENNPTLNDFIFTSFGGLDKPENVEKLERFVSTSTVNAAESGSTDFIIKAADFTSPSFVRANLGGKADDFLLNMQVPKCINEADRLKAEADILKSMAVVTGKAENEFDLTMYSKVSKDAKQVLKFSEQYAADVAISEGLTDYDPMKLPDMFPDYFW